VDITQVEQMDITFKGRLEVFSRIENTKSQGTETEPLRKWNSLGWLEWEYGQSDERSWEAVMKHSRILNWQMAWLIFILEDYSPWYRWWIGKKQNQRQGDQRGRCAYKWEQWN
jgi:hypothetical protein